MLPVMLPVMLLPPLLLLLPLLWAGTLAQVSRYSMRLEQQVTVQEGQCVLVPCIVAYPDNRHEQDPTHGYWYKQSRSSSGTESALVATNDPAQSVQEETRGRFHLLGDPRAHSCSLDIRDARREDTGTYVFRLERGAGMRHSYTDHPLNVTVTALTQTPHVQVPQILQFGHPSYITCSEPWTCPGGMPPTFSWMGVDLPSQGTHSPVLSLTLGPQHHGTNLTCRVSFPGANVSTERTVRLSVAYAPQNLAIQMISKEGSGPTALGNGSALPVQEGQSLHLVCVVDSRPPASLSWVRGSLTVKSSASLSPEGAGGVGEHSQSLELELPSVHLDDHGPFICRAQHPLGSQETSLYISVQRQLGFGTGVILGAAGGAGITALLGLCLFFKVRRRRRSRKEGAAGRTLGETRSRKYVNGSWTVTTSDSSGASVSLREGAGAALHLLQDPQGKAPDLQDQETTVSRLYSEIKF